MGVHRRELIAQRHRLLDELRTDQYHGDAVSEGMGSQFACDNPYIWAQRNITGIRRSNLIVVLTVCMGCACRFESIGVNVFCLLLGCTGRVHLITYA